MGQFTPTTISAGATDLVDKLNTIFSDIATAHNSHSTGDFPSGSVPITALTAAYYTWTMRLTPAVLAGSNTGCLTAGLTTATVLDEFPCPRGATVASVKAIALGVSGGTPVIDVYKNGTTILSTGVSIAAANTVYSGSVSVTSAAASDIFSLRATTAAGVTANGVVVIVEFKAQLTT